MSQVSGRAATHRLERTAKGMCARYTATRFALPIEVTRSGRPSAFKSPTLMSCAPVVVAAGRIVGPVSVGAEHTVPPTIGWTAVVSTALLFEGSLSAPSAMTPTVNVAVPDAEVATR